MTTQATIAPAHRGQDLLGQTVVVIGGSAGIGLETARLARAQGAQVILAARDPERLQLRVNMIAAGFVDTPLSACILGDQLDTRREELRTALPIHRVE
jgi:NAD(P)-dependent dehydrogenase (short-subunit alcohol dehydrogenase family)